jgi:hypothetical protein
MRHARRQAPGQSDNLRLEGVECLTTKDDRLVVPASQTLHSAAADRNEDGDTEGPTAPSSRQQSPPSQLLVEGNLIAQSPPKRHGK